MKTIDELIKSRETRAAVIRELGEVPESILRHDRTDKAIDLMAQERSYAAAGNFANPEPFQTALERKLHQVADVSGQSCRGQNGALSRFSQNVGRMLLRLYTKTGDTVVDPFAGHNSRMELCWRSGRNYIGHDISRVFMEMNRKVAALLQEELEGDMFGKEHFRAWIRLHECDSRRMPTADEAGDFTITSPPYWDLEHYGDEHGQLGNRSYGSFLDSLRAVAADNCRCLKPGAFCVWCVNDFRKNGKFYSFHEDVASLMRGAGFRQHDALVIDLGPAIRAAFASQVVETKIVPKRHEYCLVFRRKESRPRPPTALQSCQRELDL